jgi:F-type H+-transporting ATPase subunit epsilon
VAELHVELVAADRMVWEGTATMVSARGVEGDIGIMAGHTPMMTILTDGEVRITTGGATETAHVSSGFMTVDRDNVVIVAESVETAGQRS